MGELLERDEHLAVLHDALADVRAGTGRLILLGGEAGGGKTALLRAFSASVKPDARVLCGRCDALFTPRPLGPLADVADDTGGALAELVAGEPRAHELLGALTDELGRRETVLFLEDLHWADGATLDLLRLLGRRAETLRALVVATYRNDELEEGHPLRLVLGELAAAHGVRRLNVSPLSADAVAALAPPGVDASALHELTGGNAFFVTEVLAAEAEGVPETVRDAVLARVARLSPEGRRLIEAIAVVAPRAELWLLEELAPGEIGVLGECMAAGAIGVEYGAVGFRHELARVAIEESLPPDRRVALHRLALAALQERAGGNLARIAHHAEAAGASAAVLDVAPRAAEQAARHGAHREAAAHYARALRFAEDLPPDEKATLLERHGEELFLVDAVEDARGAFGEALELRRRTGDALRQGAALRNIARCERLLAHHDRAQRALGEAIELLSALPPSRELALAYVTAAAEQQVMLRDEEAVEWAGRAVALAEELGERDVVTAAKLAVGAVAARNGDTDLLERTLAEALAGDLEVEAARAYGALVFAAARRCDWAAAERWLADGLRFTAERDLEGWRIYLVAWRAVASLGRARWDEAAADAQSVLARPGPDGNRMSPLLVLACVRIRRGDPDVWSPLDEVAEIARRSTDSPRRLVPVELVRAEAAYLAGDSRRALVEAGALPAADTPDRWMAGRLAVVRHRAGGTPEDPGPLPEPFVHELADDAESAADAWDRLGCPYDAAFALSFSDDVDSLRRAHERLVELGARPAAALAAKRLRERGVRGIPRGPRPTTSAHPAGLTRRELEVLTLVGDGLRNTDIAERLVISEKTVDHHVSAILRKLGAKTRTEAVRLAAAPR